MRTESPNGERTVVFIRSLVEQHVRSKLKASLMPVAEAAVDEVVGALAEELKPEIELAVHEYRRELAVSISLKVGEKAASDA